MRSRSSTRALGLLALLTLPAAGAAQQDTLHADSAYRLLGVTVTATRVPVRRDLVPQQVDVITSADLDRTVARDLPDVLKKTVGVDIIQYPGLLAGVAIRGFRPQFSGLHQRTLVLLDGRPAGATNLASIDLSGVERVEVLKGPASALYGSNAMGGVINVVTRRSRGGLASDAFFGYGSYGTYRGGASIGGNLTRAIDVDLAVGAYGRIGDYEVGAGRLLGADSITKTLADGTTRRVAEAAGDTLRPFSEFGVGTVSLRLGYRLAERWSAEGRFASFNAGDTQNPGDLTASYDSRTLNDLRRRTGELSLRGGPAGHSILLRGFANRELTQYYNKPERPYFVSFRAPIVSYGAQLQDAVALGAHAITAGLDYLVLDAESAVFSAHVTPAPLYSPNSVITSGAAFAQGRFVGLGERLVATLGGRLDRVSSRVEETELFNGALVTPNEESDLVFNPSLGLQYRVGDVRLHGTAGRAFVTPDAFAIAGYSERRSGARAVAVAQGNPELSPERSTSFDLGAGLLRPALGLEADLTYFHTLVRDRITTRTGAPTELRLTANGDTVRSETLYLNADEGEIRGLEGQLSLDLGALRGAPYSLRLFGNATRILRAEEITAGVTREIKNVADLTLNAGVDYDDLRRFSTRVSGRYVGERMDSDFSDWMNPGDLRYPAFLVMDLSANLRLGGRYRLGARIENLTDENYYEVRGYNLPGRTILFEIGATF